MNSLCEITPLQKRSRSGHKIMAAINVAAAIIIDDLMRFFLILSNISSLYHIYGMDKVENLEYNVKVCGSLAQLARAPRLHRGGQGFEPLATHQSMFWAFL